MSLIHLKVDQPQISSEDPFKDDILGRGDVARNLTSFLDTFVDQPFTLGLNGVWGSGKTHLIERWQIDLRAKGYQTLKFNAWESDFAEDPFAALLGEFRQIAAKSDEVRQYQKLVKAGIPVLKRVGAGVVKNLTLGLVDLDSKDMEAAIAAITEGAASEAIARCEAQRDSVHIFRRELEAFVKKKQEDSSSKPIYYFIDELDRCRPTFALSVLERVKHLLQVKGIVFIFAWDRLQLNSTIQTVYGHHTSVNGYLLRFVDLEYDLPRGSVPDLIKQMLERYNLRGFLLAEGRADEIAEAESSLELHVYTLGLSIRELEKAITLLAIHTRMVPKDRRGYMDLACFLVAIRIKHPHHYRTIRDVTPDFESLLTTELPKIFGATIWKGEQMGYIEAYLIFHFDKAKKQLKKGADIDALRSWDKGAIHGDGKGPRVKAMIDAYDYLLGQRGQKSVVAMVTHDLEFGSGFV